MRPLEGHAEGRSNRRVSARSAGFSRAVATRPSASGRPRAAAASRRSRPRGRFMQSRRRPDGKSFAYSGRPSGASGIELRPAFAIPRASRSASVNCARRRRSWSKYPARSSFAASVALGGAVDLVDRLLGRWAITSRRRADGRAAPTFLTGAAGGVGRASPMRMTPFSPRTPTLSLSRPPAVGSPSRATRRSRSMTTPPARQSLEYPLTSDWSAAVAFVPGAGPRGGGDQQLPRFHEPCPQGETNAPQDRPADRAGGRHIAGWQDNPRRRQARRD